MKPWLSIAAAEAGFAATLDRLLRIRPGAPSCGVGDGVGEGHGWAVAQRRVRADTIGVVLPGSDHDLSLFQVVEDFQLQALIPEFAQRGRPPESLFECAISRAYVTSRVSAL